MSIRLIINSDDYGRSADVSLGIREAHLSGVVTSTTCMMNLPTTVWDIRIALQIAPKLGLGVHLDLTCGRPLLPPEQVPTLVDEAGVFFNLPQFIARLVGALSPAIDAKHARAEWRAQIETFIAASGRRPTHLDSHHHSSYFSPALMRGMFELASEYGTAIRLPVPNMVDAGTLGLPDEIYRSYQEFMPGLIAEFNPPRPDCFI